MLTTHAYVQPEYTTFVVEMLNSFDQNIKFTFELENDGCIPFLDVLIKRDVGGNIITTVYRKPTNTDLYINWHSH